MTDDEIERLARSYAGQDFRETQTVTEQPVFVSFDEEWTFHAFVETIMAAVPTAYRDKARVRFYDADYGSGQRLVVEYDRPERDEEVAERVKDALDYAAREKRAERDEYSRLKAKFENRS